MIIAIMGESGSGKSTMETELAQLGYAKIVSTTTRQRRPGEINGVDYNFVTVPIFEKMIHAGKMLEWELYSQNRYYGIAISDIPKNTNSVAVVTPNGYRALKKLDGVDVFGVYLTASLGNRMIRYITRCGVKSFNYDDKNEICARVERDYGMFLGIEKEVDITVTTDSNFYDPLGTILQALRKRGDVE